jgi:hypothetical protein
MREEGSNGVSLSGIARACSFTLDRASCIGEASLGDSRWGTECKKTQDGMKSKGSKRVVGGKEVGEWEGSMQAEHMLRATFGSFTVAGS